MQPGDDVVTQGDLADFCFIIAHGKCNIIVSLPPSPETGERSERLVTQLPAGSLVGEAGLLSETGRRNASVRAAGRAGRDAAVEVLVLQKKDFLDLDRETLDDIKEIAQWNSACSKEADRRTEEDLDLLQRCTAELDYCKQLPLYTHRELCRLMKYRKVAPETTLVEKGSVATKLFVILSGQAAVYSFSKEAKPLRRNLVCASSFSSLEEGGRDVSPEGARRGSSPEAARSSEAVRRGSLFGVGAVARATRFTLSLGKEERSRPTSMLESGEAIGEAELMYGLAANQLATSVVATEEGLEVMEVDRADFDRVLKPCRWACSPTAHMHMNMHT